jgi:hypothetical protein
LSDQGIIKIPFEYSALDLKAITALLPKSFETSQGSQKVYESIVIISNLPDMCKGFNQQEDQHSLMEKLGILERVLYYTLTQQSEIKLSN